jgi:hypothetical protein
MERGPIRTANGEHRGERGDLGIKQKLNHGFARVYTDKNKAKSK